MKSLTAAPQFGRIWALNFCVRAQHLAHFVHCFALRVSDHVAVNPERDARVRVPHVLLRDFWIRARVDQQARVARVERLKGGRYLGTSPDVPGLVAEGRSVAEAVEIAQGLARKIVESCLEQGDPLPRVFRNKQRPNQEFRVPVSVF